MGQVYMWLSGEVGFLPPPHHPINSGSHAAISEKLLKVITNNNKL